MTAILETGGKQYRVQEGDVINIEKIEANVKTEVKLENVLAIIDEKGIRVGKPFVPKASVTAEVVKTAKAKKIIVYKMKPKKNYRRKQGHRQLYTQVKIKSINA